MSGLSPSNFEIVRPSSDYRIEFLLILRSTPSSTPFEDPLDFPLQTVPAFGMRHRPYLNWGLFARPPVSEAETEKLAFQVCDLDDLGFLFVDLQEQFVFDEGNNIT